MGQNKLENQISEKVNSREIQPSAQAWDRLDAMLSVAEEKKTKRSFGWLYIAASVLVLVALGTFFFTQKSTEINQNTIVGTEVKNGTVVKTPNSKFQIPISKENPVAVANQPTTNSQQATTNNQRVSISNQSTPTNQKQATAINQKQATNPLINRDKTIEFQNSSDVALKDLPKIYTGSQVISGGVKEVKSDEALLASLDKSAKQSTNKSSNVTVDAKSLLSLVDGEIELTFREKVIKKVAKNYKEVKVALANRNNEQ